MTSPAACAVDAQRRQPTPTGYVSTAPGRGKMWPGMSPVVGLARPESRQSIREQAPFLVDLKAKIVRRDFLGIWRYFSRERRGKKKRVAQH